MSHSVDNDSMEDAPSTPRSTNNVQDNVVNAESVPQAGSYQPTPPGSKFWIPEAKKKPVEGTEFDTSEQAFVFYKEYAREDVECRNYRQGLDNFIGNRDAQMVVEKLLSRQEFLSDFSVEYKQDKNDKTLIGLFWSDAQAKLNYAAFGDVVSFDATFRSNSVQESDSCSTFVIRDMEADYRIKGSWVRAKYEVTYVPDPCSAKCTCLRYECYGLLCRHIFYVLRMSRVFHFPKQYMDNRWSKHAMTHRTVDANKASPGSTNSVSVVDATVREIYSNVEESLNHLVGDIEKLHIYTDDQTTLMEKAKLDVPSPPKLNTNEAYARTLGVTEPAELTIFTPTGINNKGHVMRTRRKSKTEIAMELSDKPMRKCKSCGKLARHDSRNCPLKKKGLQDEDVDQSNDDYMDIHDNSD
ncbi:FAR1 DNA binding domain, Zinc finger, SWIM-type, MULE transposase domain, FHY3/FAR1 family [Artemisia annua]|uniref:FAR1 DNA binding domain, Zinc finger, SWIM-type, MULE transposase domain, FHY3/FAR1 family n=1 Tax=Artemisia annua TaxID=35608 RepID=A0A2U1LCN2_ARTAN|nr:FAR1 DNA binding domain, Zinc finger, SWIM-type, MULE transposase domain, FHY3/FAR1 family [Artemisia annua]